MPIASDFSIDYVNKRIYHSANTNLYTVNELYTWLMSTFDDIGQMDDQVPITAQTPTEYTLVNGWFMDDDSIKYLYGGAIQTSGWGTGEIRHLHISATAYTTPVPSDIGLQVLGGTTGDTGILLAYQGNESGNYEWYVRPTDPLTDLFDDAAEVVEVTTAGGSGTGDSYKAAPTGETLWANIYTLGTIASDPYALAYVKRGDTEAAQAYVFENIRADTANWWSVGHIDVLLKVKDADIYKNSGEVTVYAREYGDLYDQFTINLTAGGRNAVPLATSTDLDNSEGSHYLMYDGAGASVVPVVGDLINNGGTFRAEVVAITEWVAGTSGNGLLELGNVIVGDLADNDTITDGASATVTVNGTVGDTYFEYTAEAVALTAGLVITGGTTGATRIVRGYQDDGTTGKVVSQVQGAGALTDYLPFSMVGSTPTAETVTDSGSGSVTTDAAESLTIVSGYSDVQIMFINQKVPYGTLSGTFEVNELVTQAVTGAYGEVVADDGSTLTLGNRSSTWFDTTNTVTGGTSGATCIPTGTGYTTSGTTKNFTQQTAYSYKVVVDCKGRPLSEVYAYFKFINGDGSTFGLSRTTDNALTTYKLFDVSGGTYTSYLTEVNNLDSTGDVPVFDADPETGDIIYFSGDEVYSKIKLYVGTAGVGTWTYDWEYWNGAWTALPSIGVSGVPGDAENLHFRTAGKSYITYDMPTDWATTTVDGVLGYFTRAVLTYTSTTTAPIMDYNQLYGPQYTVQGRVYSEAHFGYVPVKASPFGTYAGGTYFGARGVWVENMHADDIQSFQLKDADNITRNPPNFQALTVSNLVSGDTVTILRTTAGSVDKAVFTSTAGNDAGNGTFVVNEAIPSDTPTAGWLRIVESTTGAEERIAFTSWATSTFTLTGTLVASFGTGDTAYVPYIDTTATGATATVTVIYSASRPLLARVRRYNGAGDSILPFEAPGTLSSTGFSIATIRTDDAIVG
jgi:hypothetical protein